MSARRRIVRWLVAAALVIASLSLGGCNANVGVGVSVGVPVGDHGHIRVGSGRWF